MRGVPVNHDKTRQFIKDYINQFMEQNGTMPDDLLILQELKDREIIRNNSVWIDEDIRAVIAEMNKGVDSIDNRKEYFKPIYGANMQRATKTDMLTEMELSLTKGEIPLAALLKLKERIAHYSVKDMLTKVEMVEAMAKPFGSIENLRFALEGLQKLSNRGKVD